MKLYDYLPSGNGYKVRLLLSYLSVPYSYIPVDIHKGETHTQAFTAKNPAGQIPLLELAGGRVLAESNAILYFLAQGTPYFPKTAFDQAKCLQWMFFEQYKHEPAIAVARFIRIYAMETRSAELPALMVRGNAALGVMEAHLKTYEWCVGDALTIADIALYGYTHVAEQGGFDLSKYPAVLGWMARIAERANHVLITQYPKEVS